MNLIELRFQAYTCVQKAIRQGELPHPSEYECTDCGDPAIAYDHRDYTQPLLVDPVCKRCNSSRGPGYPYPPYWRTTLNGILPADETITSRARAWSVSPSTVVRWMDPDGYSERRSQYRANGRLRRKQEFETAVFLAL